MEGDFDAPDSHLNFWWNPVKLHVSPAMIDENRHRREADSYTLHTLPTSRQLFAPSDLEAGKSIWNQNLGVWEPTIRAQSEANCPSAAEAHSRIEGHMEWFLRHKQLLMKWYGDIATERDTGSIHPVNPI